MANFLTKLFGTKADRDMRELQPLLKKTLAAYETIKDLSIDDLRHKTVEFRDKIRTATQKEEDQVAELRHYLEENYDIPVQEKEDKYKEIEKLEDELHDRLQYKDYVKKKYCCIQHHQIPLFFLHLIMIFSILVKLELL